MAYTTLMEAIQIRTKRMTLTGAIPVPKTTRSGKSTCVTGWKRLNGKEYLTKEQPT